MEITGRYDNYDREVPDDDDFDLEYIEDEPKEEKIYEKELYRETKLKEELLKLMNKQLSLGLVCSAIWAEEKKVKIDKMLKNVKEIVQQYEKDYLSSRDEKKSILEDYEKALNMIIDWYEPRRDKKVKEIKDCEYEEQEAIKKKDEARHEIGKIKRTKEYKEYVKNKKDLIDEINKAVDEEDYEKEQCKRAELRELNKSNPILKYNIQIKEADELIQENREKIDMAKEYLHKLVEAKNNTYDKLEKEKNNLFSGLVKPNFWKKLLGAVFNKFRSGKKIALESIKKLTAQIIEECKKMSEKYEEYREERKEERDQVKAQKIVEKVQSRAKRDEDRKKRREAIIRDIENRIAETEKKIEIVRSQKAQIKGKDVTPAFEGNGNIVSFDRN